MVVGTLSLKKVMDAVDAVCSTCNTVDTVESGLWWWGHCHKKVKPVDGGCKQSTQIVVYGGGDIVFDTKKSNQWKLAVRSECSGKWYMMVGTLVLKKVKPVDAVDAVCSGCSTQSQWNSGNGGGDIDFGGKKVLQWNSMQWTVYSLLTQWMQWMQWNNGGRWRHCFWCKKLDECSTQWTQYAWNNMKSF